MSSTQTVLSDDHATEFALKLQSPEVKRTAADEIARLTATVDEIRQLFITIAAYLADIDRKHFKEQNGNVVELSTEWQGYRDVSCSFTSTMIWILTPTIDIQRYPRDELQECNGCGRIHET